MSTPGWQLAEAFRQGLAVFAICGAALAQDSAKQATPEAKSDEGARAADFLQSVVESMRVQRDQKDDKALRPRSKPLLKYSDGARGYPAAGVWRLGESGRPKGLVSLEYWLRAETDEPRLMFEFNSFTTDKFDLKPEKDDTTWRADGTAPEFAALPEAPKPAASEKQRLIQMRTLARRFTASEKHLGDFASLRLLPQPIDRYDDADRGITDGAAFVFAYGTNPEVVLLIECEGDAWRYALSRMSWAESVIKFDDKEVARYPQLTTFPTTGAYQTAGHVVQLPGAK